MLDRWSWAFVRLECLKSGGHLEIHVSECLRGLGHSVLVRPHAGEAYAVIEANPSLGGEALAYYALDPTLPAPVGTGGFARAYSMEGQVFGLVYFSGPPPAEEVAAAE